MSINETFQKINQLYFSGQQNLSLKVFISEIESASKYYFLGDYNKQDDFFNQFTPIWIDLLKKSRFAEAEEIWQIALSVSQKWEKSKSRVHKGTPYYFLGVTQILNNNLEDGFLSIHQALEEDKITHNTLTPSRPAYFFTTLDYNQSDQFFKTKVIDISQYLANRIHDYQKDRSGTLTLEELKERFLENTDLREEVFLFVYSIFRLQKILENTDQKLLCNELSAILHGKLFFDLGLVIEKAIEYKNPDSLTNPKLMFSHEINFLMDEGLLSMTKNQRDKINSDFKNFEQTLKEILTNKYSISIPKIEEDIMIAYRIRNFAAHKIEKQSILYKENKDIGQRLFNALFYIIEKLYSSIVTSSTTTSTTTSTSSRTSTSTSEEASHKTSKTDVPPESE